MFHLICCRSSSTNRNPYQLINIENWPLVARNKKKWNKISTATFMLFGRSRRHRTSAHMAHESHNQSIMQQLWYSYVFLFLFLLIIPLHLIALDCDNKIACGKANAFRNAKRIPDEISCVHNVQVHIYAMHVYDRLLHNIPFSEFESESKNKNFRLYLWKFWRFILS